MSTRTAKAATFPRAAADLEEALGVGVVAVGDLGIEIADALGIIEIGGGDVLRFNVFAGNGTTFQARENLLRRISEIPDAEVIDEFQLAAGIDPREERELRVGRPALTECTASVVGDAAHDGCTDGGGADHRMRRPPERLEQLFQLMEGGAGKGEHLPAAFQQDDLGQASGIDDDNRSAIVVTTRAGTFG